LFGIISIQGTCRYSLKDVSIPTEVKTVKVFFIENKARYINPQLSPKLTDKLRQKIVNQTRLSQTNNEADYEVSGYISDYSVSTSGISQQQVASNNLNVTVHIIFRNRLDEKKHFEADITRNFPFSSSKSLTQAEGELNEQIINLYTKLSNSSNLKLHGLHVYDGHLRASDFNERKKECDAGFVDVKHFIDAIETEGLAKPIVIAGGTPAFTTHALRNETYCSPGTCVLWDWGYGDKLIEQNFEYAALILCRVISKPKHGIITVDMGHKAVAAENPIDKRIRFLNLENYELLGQSEEHGVIAVKDWDVIKVGDVLYGVPYHICPTVNLYDEAYIVENKEVKETWQVLGRKRKISV
jgi:hypothetical protein